jgi:hypothetical protein
VSIDDLRAQALTESRILREALPPSDAQAHLTYKVHVTCPRCAGPVQHLTSSAPARSLCLEQAAVFECVPCGDSIVLSVQLTSQVVAQRRLASLAADTCLNPPRQEAIA